jgi:NAD(P)-dependent dehydrogenase (short-subunit alcohol dehydrogenase family)
MNNQNKNSNPIALITGASKGLGLTLARFLAARGYDLVITARGAETLAQAQEQLETFGSRVIAVNGDVSDPNHQLQLAGIVRSFGSLDLLVNNASDLGCLPLPNLATYPIHGLREIYETNVIAPVTLVQILRPYLAASRGLVVNISSDAAVGGYEGWGGYGASKAALDLISLTLANELADEGISVVSVDPGDMRTAMQQAAFPGEDISDRPLPETTLPFWAWLLGQDPAIISGRRFQAQAELWQVPA